MIMPMRHLRCASYDGEHVLVVSRATQPHLLKVSDLKKGEINPILLDLTGVSGGTSLITWVR